MLFSYGSPSITGTVLFGGSVVPVKSWEQSHKFNAYLVSWRYIVHKIGVYLPKFIACYLLNVYIDMLHDLSCTLSSQ